MRKTVHLAISFIFTLFVYNLRAQSVTPEIVSSAGDYTKITSGSISWTVGEPVSETFEGSSEILTTGFHQPIVYLITAIDKYDNKTEVIVFPNPVMDELLIDFTGIKNGDYSLLLTDAKGQLLYQEETFISRENQQYTLSMRGRSTGTYLLTITNNNDFLKTVKIEKPQ